MKGKKKLTFFFFIFAYRMNNKTNCEAISKTTWEESKTRREKKERKKLGLDRENGYYRL